MEARETQGKRGRGNLMLKKQISGLRWEYHLERCIGTLIPGSNCARINCLQWRGFLSLHVLYTPN